MGLETLAAMGLITTGTGLVVGEGAAVGATAGVATFTGLTGAGAAIAGGVVSSGVSAALAAAMKPKIPGPPSLAPTSDDARLAAAAAQKLRGKRGRESTILTGLIQSAPPTPLKTALGQ